MTGLRWLLYWTKEKIPWVIAALVVLSSNWAANSVQESVAVALNGADLEFSWLRATYILIFVVLVVLFIKERKAFFQPRTRFLKLERNPKKRKCLIVFLSELDERHASPGTGLPEGLELRHDLRGDLKKLIEYKRSSPPWRWEMPLRAIEHHLGKLDTIIVLCSHQSMRQAGRFQKILQGYPELTGVNMRFLVKTDDWAYSLADTYDPQIHEGFNFEHFDELSDALAYLLRKFRRGKFTDSDIMIDFTGGQKVTSVVAAAITFNRSIKAQYVQTNDPWKAISYDILLASPDTGGLGVS